MAVTPLKMLTFLGGLTGAAAATAYVSGVFDPLINQQPAAIVASSGPTAPAADKPATPANTQTASTGVASTGAASTGTEAKPAAPAATAPSGNAPVAATTTPAVLSFDVLRVEPDGSVVIGGQAAPDANVEILDGDKVIGKTKAAATGDFAIVLDEPLKPGDYQLALRAAPDGGQPVNSQQTAVVSVPATPNGQVLAMVEQAGAPSRVLVKPTEPAVGEPADAASAKSTISATGSATVTTATPSAPSGAPAQQTLQKVVVEAVEIDGGKMFVAGSAPANATVRVYANDELLGETKAAPEGRFLLELNRDLKPGDYQVRADALGPDGKEVLARAEVAFSRETGESVAAVAPEASAQSAGQQVATPPKAGDKSAATQPTAAETPKLQASASGVIIRRGDSLWRISRRVYGHGVRFSTIYLANDAQIRDPNRIYPGQVFRVPDKTAEGDAADLKTMGDQVTPVE